MIILFEGVDGSGKTTLMNKFEEYLTKHKYDFELSDVLKIGTLPNSPTRLSQNDLIKTLIEMGNSDTIYLCDRGPLSDVVYRTFDDIDPVINLSQLIMIINGMYLNLQSKITIVITETDNSEELMNQRGEHNEVAINYHNSIKYLYRQIGPILGAQFYDFTQSDTEKFIVNVIKMTTERRVQYGTKRAYS